MDGKPVGGILIQVEARAMVAQLKGENMTAQDLLTAYYDWRFLMERTGVEITSDTLKLLNGLVTYLGTCAEIGTSCSLGA